MANAPPLTVSFPPDIIVGGGFIIEVAATNPNDDSYVSGVKVQNVTLTVEVLQGGIAGPDQPLLLTFASPSG